MSVAQIVSDLIAEHREQDPLTQIMDYDTMVHLSEITIMKSQEANTVSKLEYEIIDVKNSIALVKWADGKLVHIQTSSLSEEKLKEYWETKARETREYYNRGNDNG